MKLYLLKHYDTPIAGITRTIDQYSQEQLDIQVDKEKQHLLPIGLQRFGLSNWIDHRLIPKNRYFVEQVIQALGNPTRMDTLDISFGLSLNDSYWITPLDFKGSFSDYSLYENSFSEVLGLIAFTGYGDTISKFGTSPELTTNGMLPKCWRRTKHGIELYKGGTFGAANDGLEPYSEFYAVQVAKTMGLNCVDYDLKKFKGKLVSTCPLFTTKDTGYIPMGYITDAKIGEIIKLYGYEEFTDLVLFDSIICNTDRHLGNFGLLIDNKTNKPIAQAPIFDNGLSLFHRAMKDDFKRGIENYNTINQHALNLNIKGYLKTAMTPSHKGMLRRLINFKFTKHRTYNLPDWRLYEIEKFIQKRVQELLTL